MIQSSSASDQPRRSKRSKLKKPALWKCLAAYGICIPLLAGSIIFFCCPDIVPQINVPEAIDRLADKKALAAVIQTVGTTAIVIAWLIGVTERKVYGERIGTLINWKYPGLFIYYFTIFLLTTVFGAYVSNASSRRMSVFLAAAGVVIGDILIGRVCYVFVLSHENQERIAFSYYIFLLAPPEDPNGKTFDKYLQSLRNRIIMRISGVARVRDEGPWSLCSRIIMRISSVAGERESAGKDIRKEEIWALWEACIKKLTSQKAVSGPKEAPPDVGPDKEDPSGQYSSAACSLAARFWKNLFHQAGVPCQRESFLLSIVTEDIPQITNDVCRDHLLIGLLLMLVHERREADDQDGSNISWYAGYRILTDLFIECAKCGTPKRLVFDELFYGLVLIMIMDSATRTAAEYDLVLELAQRLGLTDSIKQHQGEKVEKIKGADEHKRFLANLRRAFLQEFGYDSGVYSRTGKRTYTDMMESYLGRCYCFSGVYSGEYCADLEVVYWLIGKELER